MTKAIIVFADGSKRMAHNMDDTRLRWYERTLARAEDIQREINRLQQDGMPILTFESDASYDALVDIRDQLVATKNAIDQRRVLLKAGGLQYAHEDRFVAIAQIETSTQLRQINNRLKDLRIKQATDSEQNKEESRKAYRKLKAQYTDLLEAHIVSQTEIIRLQSLLLERFGITVEKA